MNSWQINVIVISFAPKEIYKKRWQNPTADQMETDNGR